MRTASACLFAGLLLTAAICAPAARAGEYPGESAYDTSVHSDEALVNLRIRNHRWPDCYSLETAVADMFRIEGIDTRKFPDADEAKALAVWRWVMTLTVNSGSRHFEGHPYGTPRGKWVRCKGDPTKQQIELRRGAKIMMVYGPHECGGLSRVIACLWRAAGYLGYQEASSGHSTAALRYPDADGYWRIHSFNPVKRNYYWNPVHKIIGVRTKPLQRRMEFKRLLPPTEHTLRTSLRRGEVLRRRWENAGYFQKTLGMLRWTGKRGDHKRYMKYAVAGQEDQTLTAATDPKTFRGQLWKDSANAACSPPADGQARLHPEKAGETAAFIYRLASPYVAIESIIEAQLRTGAAGDVCRLAFSTDGGRTWHTVFEKKKPGAETVKVTVGRDRYWKPAPSITSCYNFLVKAEFKTDGDVRGVGMDGLKVTVNRQLNMRALPNLMPKENVFKVTADALRAGLALKLGIEYEVNGKPLKVTRFVAKFPHYFRIDVDGLPEKALKTPHYLARWGQPGKFNLSSHPLRMKVLSAELVPLAEAKLSVSLPARESEPFFLKAYPTPYKCKSLKVRPNRAHKYESEINDFFPQLPREANQPKDPREYYNWLLDNTGDLSARLPKAPEGTDPVKMLIKMLPKCHGCHLGGICNVLAHMKDKRAVPALLAAWEQAPERGPGDRYIPDALAAMGAHEAVPALCRRVKLLRVDHRVHVARALGILGGKQAVKTLRELVKEDPSISVRGEASRRLKALEEKKK